MSRIFKAAKLDFFACKSMLLLISILVLLGIVIGVATHGPIYTMMFIMVFGVTSAGAVFSVHEKSHSDKLYGFLPLKKTEMILGRYLYALLIGLAYVVIGAVLGLAMSRIMSSGTSPLAYWATLAIAFTYYGFATGVAYPIYFKFTFAKAYVFTMVPMYIILVLFLVLTRKTNFVSTLVSLINFFSANMYLLPVFGLLAGLVLLAVSAWISNLIYTRKEI